MSPSQVRAVARSSRGGVLQGEAAWPIEACAGSLRDAHEMQVLQVQSSNLDWDKQFCLQSSNVLQGRSLFNVDARVRSRRLDSPWVQSLVFPRSSTNGRDIGDYHY
jgi:hypothetical protein